MRAADAGHLVCSTDAADGAAAFALACAVCGVPIEAEEYFSARRVGDSVARVRELENIRQFLTGFGQQITATATIIQPIYTGGTTSSQIRQAVATDTSARVQIEAVRRTAIQTVSQAWSQRYAAELNIAVQAAQVKAAQIAFDGMRVEYRAGLRQTLEVLVAQETLTSAEASLAAARHDAYVADAQLLSAVGRLEARVLLRGQPLYQPEVSFRRNEHKDAVPWEGVPKALDRIGAPGVVARGSLPAPPASSIAASITLVPYTSLAPIAIRSDP